MTGVRKDLHSEGYILDYFLLKHQSVGALIKLFHRNWDRKEMGWHAG
jgi:hypothetical protein